MSKTILITGSTDGIGKLAAIRLAKEGHTLYLHGRNSKKLDKVIKEIVNLTGNDKISGFIADFTDLEVVKKMGNEVKSKLNNLDVLINNAGVFKSPNQTNTAGLDLRLVVNYLSPYLLTKELIPLLEKGSAPRIINLSSAAQEPVSFKALKGKESLSAQSSYAQSKLALTMWSFYLARQLNNISVIAVNPGSLLDTQMVREAYGKFWSPASKGGDILYELAVSEEYSEKTGKYFDNDKGNPKGSFGEAHRDAYDAGAIQELITNTDQILLGNTL